MQIEICFEQHKYFLLLNPHEERHPHEIKLFGTRELFCIKVPRLSRSKSSTVKRFSNIL